MLEHDERFVRIPAQAGGGRLSERYCVGVPEGFVGVKSMYPVLRKRGLTMSNIDLNSALRAIKSTNPEQEDAVEKWLKNYFFYLQNENSDIENAAPTGRLR